MSSKEELACIYSALILADDEIPVTAEKLTTILKAAKVTVEPFWPTLFARALNGMDIKSMLTNIGSASAAAPAAGGAAPAGGAPAEEKKEEKKKEESEEESDDDMGFGLFD